MLRIFLILFFVCFLRSAFAQEEEDWDVIVLGSGIAGLSAASYLCNHGKRVLVLEQGSSIGGSLNMFQRTVGGNTYEFSVGLHYLGNDSSVPLSVFDELIYPESLKYEQVDVSYDLMYFEKAGKLELYEILSPTAEWWAYMEKKFPDANISAIREKIQTETDPTARIHEYLVTVTSNKELITIIEHFGMNIGSENPLILEVRGLLAFANGGYFYPYGGSQKLVNYLEESIKKDGTCQLLAGCQASELLTSARLGSNDNSNDNNSEDFVTGVKACEREFKSSNVLSAMGVHNTFSPEEGEGIVSLELLEKYGYLDVMTKLVMSFQVVVVWFGFNKHAKELGFVNSNICYYPEDENEDAKSYWFESTALRDGEMFDKPQSDLTFIIKTDYSLFQQWENTTVGKRPEEYYDLKEKFVEKAKEVVGKFYPGVLEHNEIIVSGSPLTFRDFLLHHEGSCYGILGDLFSWQHFQIETPIDGLFLAGQDVVDAGVQPNAQNGIEAAKKILSQTDES